MKDRRGLGWWWEVLGELGVAGGGLRLRGFEEVMWLGVVTRGSSLGWGLGSRDDWTIMACTLGWWARTSHCRAEAKGSERVFRGWGSLWQGQRASWRKYARQEAPE